MAICVHGYNNTSKKEGKGQKRLKLKKDSYDSRGFW